MISSLNSHVEQARVEHSTFKTVTYKSTSMSELSVSNCNHHSESLDINTCSNEKYDRSASIYILPHKPENVGLGSNTLLKREKAFIEFL